MDDEQVLRRLERLRNKTFAKGMERFGVRPKTRVLGVSVPAIRKIAKSIGTDHDLALQLFESGIHEARLLATMVADSNQLTEKQFETWVDSFDSWDIVDSSCSNLFRKVSFSYKKIFELSTKKEEFVKRTAFALMASFAVHSQELQDKDFIVFFPLIKREAVDERNFVKKAVNWALRQVGKRSKSLNAKALILAKEILKINSKSAMWIAKDAIRELESKKYN